MIRAVRTGCTCVDAGNLPRVRRRMAGGKAIRADGQGFSDGVDEQVGIECNVHPVDDRTIAGARQAAQTR